MTGSANSDQPLRLLHTLLLATDSKSSVLANISGGRINRVAYSAFGFQSAEQEEVPRLGFNGQFREALDWYFLGNGYRVYNPRLMRFHSPDSWSPFGEGGLNAYMYCAGDPVNFSDPTGHMGLRNFLGLQRGIARTSSASSLRPLVPTAAAAPTNPTASRAGMTNPAFDNTETQSIYKTLPALTRTTNTVVTTDTVDIGHANRMPPPIPPKKQTPRFNDTGGQVGILSPNQRPGQPARYRKIWESEAFRFPQAPAPEPRKLQNGATRYYSVSYDLNGNPTQSSVEKISMSELAERTRRKGSQR